MLVLPVGDDPDVGCGKEFKGSTRRVQQLISATEGRQT